MKTRRLHPDVRDRRGTITDILDGVSLNSVSWITCRKGSVRGNHYHKKTVQYLYMVSGRLRYFSRPGGPTLGPGGGRRRAKVLLPGDLAVSPPGEAHAIVALDDCVFLALSNGPRHGKNFEADTFRLAKSLTAPL